MTTEVVPNALQEQLDAIQQNAAPAPQQPPGVTVPVPPPVTPATDLKDGAKVLGNTGMDSPAAQNEDWKHKYDVVNGMFRKETADLREQNRQLEEELKKARESGNQGVQVSVGDISDDEVRGLVSPDMVDEFGIDYWKQQIAIQKNLAPTVTSVTDDRVQNIEAQFAEQNKQAFYQQLTGLVPNWEQINGTAEWNTFLGRIEPLSGATYEAILVDAYDNFDAGRTAQLFQAFLSAPNRTPGFEGLATPAPRQANNGNSLPGQTMTFEDWNAQMQAVSSGGLSPMEVLQKQKELMDVWEQGRVTGAPQGNPPLM